jgi:hypothetical protein
LGSFDAVVDCVAENNRLKAAGNSKKGEFGTPRRNSPATSDPGHFPDAKRRTIRVRKMFCHRAGDAEKQESNERDLRHEI